MGQETLSKNPNFCNLCEEFVRTHPGGAEIDLSLLFADVRDSTSMAERMTPAEFASLMNRFFKASSDVLIGSDALVDKFVGDEVIGLFLPAIVADHPAAALEAGRRLLSATRHGEPGGPWLPIGIGVHSGTAYVGSVGDGLVADFTAKCSGSLGISGRPRRACGCRGGVDQRRATSLAEQRPYAGTQGEGLSHRGSGRPH
ncbi:adenylate/guanylate cyclase domain-containing protein [Mesorhizobium sp. f-mel]